MAYMLKVFLPLRNSHHQHGITRVKTAPEGMVAPKLQKADV